MPEFSRPTSAPATTGDSRALAIYETYETTSQDALRDDLDALETLHNDAHSSLSQPYVDFVILLRGAVQKRI